MSGAVAVGALLVVIELGAPVASNLGLSAVLPSAGHGGTAAQALQDPSFLNPGQSATSVASATAAAPVTPAPAPVTPAPTTQTVAFVASLQPSAVVASSKPGAAGTSDPSVSVQIVSPPAAAVSSPPTTENGAHASGNVSSQSGGSSGQVSSFVSSPSDPHSGGNPQGLGGGQGGGSPQAQGNGGSHGQGNGQGNGGSHGQGNNGHGAGSD
jgi:hypothetical protein